MKAKSIIALAVAAALAGPFASAQEPSPGPKDDTVFYIANGAAPIMPLGGKIDVLHAGAASVLGEVVEGKPYTADSITESIQMLADGNRITTTNRARAYRDSEGRTRREQQLDSVGVWKSTEPVSIVTINDPVKNVSYFLDSRTETVRELAQFRFDTKVELSGSLELSTEGDVSVAADRVIMSREPGVVVHEYADGEQVSAVALGPTTGAQPFELALPPTGAARGAAFGSIAAFKGAPTSPPVTEDLGEQVLEGVLARGTRQTRTIEPGAIGNERPIQIVHEEWYSADIEAVVLRRDFDPRFGETTYRLINVDRSEPPAELFAIPEDYVVQREPSPRTVVAGPGPKPGVPAERRVFVVQPDPAPPPQE